MDGPRTSRYKSMSLGLSGIWARRASCPMRKRRPLASGRGIGSRGSRSPGVNSPTSRRHVRGTRVARLSGRGGSPMAGRAFTEPMGVERRGGEGDRGPDVAHAWVNGTPHPLPEDPRVPLLDFLREHLGLTGTKVGCDHGQCGACTVLVNRRRVNACLTLAVSLAGDQVTTVEGLASPDGQLHPVQAAFLEHDAFQCGYCTPGQLCSAAAPLAESASGEPHE